MQGRGLAVAWGLLAALVAGTVAWLVLTGEPDRSSTAPLAVTVEIPPFPAEPAEEPDPAVAARPTPPSEPSPTGSRSAALEVRQGRDGGEATRTVGGQTAGGHAAEPFPKEQDPVATEDSGANLPGTESRPDELPVAEAPPAEAPDSEQPPAEVPAAQIPPAEIPAAEVPTAEVPAKEVPTAEVQRPDAAQPEEPRSAPAEAVQEIPNPATAGPHEEPDSEESAGPARGASAPAPSAPEAPLPEPPPSVVRAPDQAGGDPEPTERRQAIASEEPSAKAEAPPAVGTPEPARPAADAETHSEPLPPTVEVGTLRPIPDAPLRPLKPPEGPRADPALTENGPFGPLPTVAPDGRRPWNAYSRPFSAAPDAPRVSVVIGNLGLASGITEKAINELPPEVTLSFAPYAENVDSWVAKARAAGHEVMLDLPMEPINYPKHDPGPKALFTHLELEQNIQRLQWVLSRAVGYVGVTNFMGSRFTTSPEALRPVLEALRDRGLMFLDSRSAARSLATTMASDIELPRAINDRFIDVKASRAAIDRRLNELEEIAMREGAAVGIGYPYPVTVDRVARWAKNLEDRKDIELAPISALVGRQADR